ncbi:MULTISPECIES: extracellular catalytic domain type 1 short-chain-length polyhydroxyalkanoate depolymerase [Priestia]|uniref:extracellular catalytic domain type 1 short-chain-length polyhydroxyalkanoate depolymerase n=1 Tax=Priestia TaxID=2800373 RepID=UPI001455315C|nr:MULTISPECIES: PHB depolymerase family esterase [Priestia]MBY0008718.1 PHB depolymerase family esterase [Priestia aryabhattai]MBY0050034.1 PHB depolymerase family esterase [Priestia aryabhattai]MDE8675986.1 PHB depolymerase family esterase [Priestia aryabhattai]MED3955310.1 PHB depolymerase family esterase [Priestia aryabhattai]MED4390874.1 PHB depolymerase family esterase [Priestia aryabhattai]
MKRLFIAGMIFMLFLSLGAVSSSAAGSFTSKTYNGRTYKLYVPSSYQGGAVLPLVVMLHGCTQDPDQFAAGTQMNALAETEKFFVLYPEQPSSANSNKCWNWFDTAHQSRGSGEPALIAGMVNQIKSSYSIDADQVFVGGLSAGAAMSVIMGATYPDIFAAISVGAGLEYKAATSVTGAYTAMSSGGPNPIQQGDLAYLAMGEHKRVVPVILFHGTADYTVAPINAHQILSQWAQTNDRASDGLDNNNIDDTADQTLPGTVSGGRSYTQYIYKDTAGKTVMEKYMIEGMGHAWSGGSTSGSYTDHKGPNATKLSWNFFKNHPKNGDAPNPGDISPPVTAASPAGGTYGSSVSVTLSPNEPATTYYTLDGSTPTVNSLKYSEPISINSSKTIKFFSVDAAGNQEGVKTEVYQISGTSEKSSVFSSLAAKDGFIGNLSADGMSSSIHKIGDKGMYNTDTYRTILSFDTSSLPDDASITDVSLKIYRKSSTGNISSLKGDIKSGVFGTSSALEQIDYQASPSISAAFQMSVPSLDNGYTTIQLPSSLLGYMNRNGKTQFRLSSSGSADFLSDVVEIYGGDNPAYAPTLTVSYK